MRDDDKRQRSSEYCNFQKDRGHTSEECYQLREEIERLIHLVHLEDNILYPKNLQTNGNRIMEDHVSPKGRKAQHEPRRRLVNVIEGGGYGGFTRSAQKETHAKKPLKYKRRMNLKA
ncbi:hypothetical protein Salat_0517400 [Sesamum alatum]|uniref:Reverse transcriptase domain-containing protein n=1 Tax=Sesamum alatum TaxID=300844 RepID=A0AAE1Z422_9LAMI|nr:hypothetical protein Salat_0517400 [Sesamum alatum]